MSGLPCPPELLPSIPTPDQIRGERTLEERGIYLDVCGLKETVDAVTKNRYQKSDMVEDWMEQSWPKHARFRPMSQSFPCFSSRIVSVNQIDQ